MLDEMTNDRRRFGGAPARSLPWRSPPDWRPDCAAAEAPVRLNETQVIGTHNSYHVQADKPMLALIEQFSPELRRSLEYGHRPLPEQLSRLGIRQVELDIFADPKGGLFANPRGPKMAAALGLPAGAPYDPQGAMRRPGFKVMHVQDVDFRSTVPTFVAGLKQIRDWSAAHPRHFPIFVLVELKDETPMPLLTKPIPFGAAELDAVDAEILSVFQRGEIHPRRRPRFVRVAAQGAGETRLANARRGPREGDVRHG